METPENAQRTSRGTGGRLRAGTSLAVSGASPPATPRRTAFRRSCRPTPRTAAARAMSSAFPRSASGAPTGARTSGAARRIGPRASRRRLARTLAARRQACVSLVGGGTFRLKLGVAVGLDHPSRLRPRQLSARRIVEGPLRHERHLGLGALHLSAAVGDRSCYGRCFQAHHRCAVNGVLRSAHHAPGLGSDATPDALGAREAAEVRIAVDGSQKFRRPVISLRASWKYSVSSTA